MIIANDVLQLSGIYKNEVYLPDLINGVNQYNPTRPNWPHPKRL